MNTGIQRDVLALIDFARSGDLSDNEIAARVLAQLSETELRDAVAYLTGLVAVAARTSQLVRGLLQYAATKADE